MKKVLLVIALMGGYLIAFSQTYWYQVEESNFPLAGPRNLVPNKYRVYELDTLILKTQLWQAPHESEVSVSNSSTIITVPSPDGEMIPFKVVQYDMMEHALAVTYPGIRTFYGMSIERHPKSIRLDWTERGFHASFYTAKGKVFIDPYSFGDKQHYAVYYKKDYPQPGFECLLSKNEHNFNTPSSDESKAGDCVFRSYRLAMATTGEYSNYHGAFNATQSGFVLSAVTTAVNRVNQVYERDLTIRMILVAGTTNIFYYTPASDPYTNNDGLVMLAENQSNIDAVIGSSSYDIGHVFSTGGGGIASLFGPCNSSSKARGVTGLGNPIGDPFYIDYVAHEMGHQFGANHTQNNDCNRNSPTAMEPGSASTIMGYAGICPPNVQNASDDYMHGVSIQEISTFVSTGGGNSCDTPISFINNAPTVSAGANYIIPVSTPFVLSASASDVNGNDLTYSWEQYDNETGPVMPPSASNTVGPMFRSFDITSSSQRYFPRLSDIVSNATPTWEVLPSVGRDMDFRITVRDVVGSAGCTAEDYTTITTSASAGPFRVTAPNTGSVVWTIGQLAQVTWSVAGTNLIPVSCATVDILLSYDGGFTYPTTLATGVANTGSTFITVPAGTSSSARVMVRCANNVFFDISNANFNIQSSVAPDYSLGSTPASQSVCAPNSAIYTINSNAIGGYSSSITLSVTDPPSGSSISFSVNPVSPGANSTLTISNIGNVSPGTYNITVQGVSLAGTKTINVELIIKTVGTAVALSNPSDGANDISIVPTLSWASQSNVLSYDFELAANASFTPVLVSSSTAQTSYQVTTELAPSTTHYWRVRSINECGTGTWSATRTFETVPCLTYSSTNVPINISSSGTPTITSTLAIGESGTIADINVSELRGTHTWISDLTIDLRSPAGTYVNLFSGICNSEHNFNINFNGQAASNSYPCPPIGGGTYIPQGSLAALNGQSMTGTWTIRIMDAFNQDGGQLQAWSIRVCPSGYSSPLPISWLYIDATPANGAIQLRWATAMEENNAGFEIERRTETQLYFEKIGWMPALANALQGANYEWLDTGVKPGVRYYYRLRQLDFDGDEDYSAIRTAMIEDAEKGISDCTLNWSLSADVVFLECPELANQTALNFAIFNAQGQLISTGLVNNSTQNSISIADWPQGVYWVVMYTQDERITKKIVK